MLKIFLLFFQDTSSKLVFVKLMKSNNIILEADSIDQVLFFQDTSSKLVSVKLMKSNNIILEADSIDQALFFGFCEVFRGFAVSRTGTLGSTEH